MNPLFGLLASPLTSGIGAAAGQAAVSVAAPFEAFLKAAHTTGSSAKPCAGSDESEDSSAALQERVAGRLRKLLSGLGVGDSQRVTLHIDKQSGEIKVGDDQPLAAEIESALSRDKQLGEDIRRLAKSNDFFHDSPLGGHTELEIDLSGDEPADLLRWL